MTAQVYLDHNASSPMRPEVMDIMAESFAMPGNPSAPHRNGRAARKLVENGREAVAFLMGVCAQDLIFTGSGTEAINTAIHSAVKNGVKEIFVSAMEHPAAILYAQSSGVNVSVIPANSNGQVDLNWLELAVARVEGRSLVCIVAANSETGVLQDIEKAIQIARNHNAFILVDAVQAFGKIPMTFLPDYLAVSAHKIGGPQGVGALYVAANVPFTPLLSGGGQEKRRRAGTLNVAGIAGFGRAAELAENGLSSVQVIRDFIENELEKMEPNLTIFGRNVPRLPNTSFFAVPDTANSTLMMGLDIAGVSVSTGLACSSGKVGASRAITAMGLTDKAPKGAIRLSLGYNSTMGDAKAFLKAWAQIRKHKQRGAA